MRACVIILLMITLTGCSGITLTARENDLIGEYAAGVLLKYDKNYNNRLVRIAEAEENSALAEEDEALVSDESSSLETEEVVSVEEETTPDIELSLHDGLKLEKLKASYEEFLITDTYPETVSEDEVVFSMKAVDGFKLLVLKFSLENPTDEPLTEDMLSKKLSFSIMVNGEIRANSQLTMLLDDLSSFKDEVEPYSAKELVLIFQIPDRYETEDTISSLTLNIKDENTSFPISLQ